MARERNGGIGLQTAAASLEHEVQQLRTQVEQLREACRLKDQALSVATHELAAPLAAMKAYVEALLVHHDDPAFTQDREFLEVLSRETDRLARIVDRTLDVSRLVRRGTNLQLEAVHLVQLVHEVARSMAPLLAAHAMRLEVRIDPGVPPVRADRDLLEQILVNLIHNAVKFSAAGGCVTVSATAAPAGVLVAVRDQGYGIAANELGLIFDPYFRSADPRIDGQRGTGLGLTIVKTLIEQHGGHIEVESQPDRGTTFRFSMPAA